jgi:hypothetical protein
LAGPGYHTLQGVEGKRKTAKPRNNFDRQTGGYGKSWKTLGERGKISIRNIGTNRLGDPTKEASGHEITQLLMA